MSEISDIKSLSEKEIKEFLESLNENEKNNFIKTLENYKSLKEKFKNGVYTNKEKELIKMGIKASETAFKELALVSAPIGGYRAMFRLSGVVLGIVAKSAIKTLFI